MPNDNGIDEYIQEFERLKGRFLDEHNEVFLRSTDSAHFKRKILEVQAFLNKKLGADNPYLKELSRTVNVGQHTFWGGPTLACV